jgi:hypothetical protein
MLRRRHVGCALHYGVAREPGGKLRAHVWVSVDGCVLMGGEEAPRFSCLATFPTQ